MRLWIAVALLSASVAGAQASAPSGPAADRDAVRRAVTDYLDGFYEGDTAKLVRSLRPEMFKYGFSKRKDSTSAAASYTGMRMTYEQALAFARGVRDNKRFPPATAPREVIIYEVQNQIASAKVKAWWGSDYLLLGKYDGRWMISHVIWQGQ